MVLGRLRCPGKYDTCNTPSYLENRTTRWWRFLSEIKARWAGGDTASTVQIPLPVDFQLRGVNGHENLGSTAVHSASEDIKITHGWLWVIHVFHLHEVVAVGHCIVKSRVIRNVPKNRREDRWCVTGPLLLKCKQSRQHVGN